MLVSALISLFVAFSADVSAQQTPQAVPGYNDSTMSAVEGKPLMVRGLKIVFEQTANVGKFWCFVEAENSTLRFSIVPVKKGFLDLADPIDGYSYSPVTSAGFEIAAYHTRIIKIESKDQTDRYLAVSPTFGTSAQGYPLSTCRFRFWTDQTVQLLAEKAELRKRF